MTITPQMVFSLFGLSLLAAGCDEANASDARRAASARLPPHLCRPAPTTWGDLNAGLSSSLDDTLWFRASAKYLNWSLLPWDHAAGEAPNIEVTAGGGPNPVEISAYGVRDANTGVACHVSYHTRRPDVQVDVLPTSSFLRLYVVPSDNADPTLLVRGPDGRYWCSNNHLRRDWGSARSPVVDVCNPQPGRYAVWVGTVDGSWLRPARLFLTGDMRHHP